MSVRTLAVRPDRLNATDQYEGRLHVSLVGGASPKVSLSVREIRDRASVFILDRDQAVELAAWLTAWAGETP